MSFFMFGLLAAATMSSSSSDISSLIARRRSFNLNKRLFLILLNCEKSVCANRFSVVISITFKRFLIFYTLQIRICYSLIKKIPRDFAGANFLHTRWIFINFVFNVRIASRRYHIEFIKRHLFIDCPAAKFQPE